MSYTALYRKYRPTEFEDVKGQDHIVTALKNQVKADRLGHAYLFTGTRGTGKTTVAKIFAKAVNCENPIDGSPCGKCASCQAICSGASMNVMEIDAASNNGVDNVRDIVEQVSYSPTEGRFKVFIIDEVHMMSTQAFNALLKTLEEPPSYVIFILATTEVNKIPITVLSRCQRYDFHRITIESIKNRMKELVEEEHNEIDDDALAYIAKQADGSMRDGLSLLDQCLAFYMNKRVTLENVLEVLGAVDQEVFTRWLMAVNEHNAEKVINIINEVVMQGRDIGQFVIDLTWYLRNVLLIKNADNLEDILDMSRETMDDILHKTENIGSEKIMRYIRVLSELTANIRYSGQKRVLAEVAFIKLCRPQMEHNMDAIIDRINQIEKTVMTGHPVSSIEEQGQEALMEAIASAPRPKVTREELPKAIPDDIKEVVKNFRSIVSEVESGLNREMLSQVKLNLSNDRLQIVFSDDLGYAFYCEGDRVQELKDIIAYRFGKQIDIEITYNDTGRPYEETYVDLESLVNMEITVEDD